MQFKAAVALTVIWKLFSIPETFPAKYRAKIGLSIKPRRKGKGKGKGTEAHGHVREVLLFHLLRFKNPFEARRLDLSVSVASSGCAPSTIPIRSPGESVHRVYMHTWRATKSIRKGEEESPLPRQER